MRGLGFLLALGACLPDGALKHRGPVIPQPLDDGWMIATPEAVGVDGAVLAAIHEELLREDRHQGALAFLVIKEGKLVFETYLRDQRDRDRHHAVQSVTKSVTSLAFGLARDRGRAPPLDARLATLVPDELAGLDPGKGEITVEHLLTMRSGLAFDNEDFSLEMWTDKPANPLRYILAKPFYAPPGERYYYRDADPQILGYLIQRAVGESEQSLVQREIFAPLGIRDFLWESGPDGVSMAAHGLHLRARDVAKLGQLMLDDCVWQGRPIVSRQWCATAATRQVQPDLERPPGTGYGYYWWLPPGGLIAAWGHGGQYIVVAPAHRLVLVEIAYPDAKLHGSDLADFLELVAPLL